MKNQDLKDENQKGLVGLKLEKKIGEFTRRNLNKKCFENSIINKDHYNCGKSIKELKNKKIGFGNSAIVIAAGPSIKRKNPLNIILKAQFKGAIVVTDSALFNCLKNNAIPDLVVTVDPHEKRIVRWFGDINLTLTDLKSDDYFSRQDLDINFKGDLDTNREIINLVNKHGKEVKIALSTCSSTSVVERVIDCGMDIYWWNPMLDSPNSLDSLTRQLYDLNGYPCINGGGNVGSSCWMISHAVLNKTKVAITGMDFSHYIETPFENTPYYKEALELFDEDELKNFYIKIFNPYLKKDFYTDPVYLWYRNIFLEMVQDADCKTFNCTEGGIIFGEKIEFCPLKTFIENEK